MDHQSIPQESDFLLYTAPNGGVKVGVLMFEEMVWLTQKRMAELFGVDVQTVSDHLQNVYKSAELSEDRTIRKFRIVQMEGDREVGREHEVAEVLAEKEFDIYRVVQDQEFISDFDRATQALLDNSHKPE